MAFPARYPGRCLKCNNEVERGHTITWSRIKGQKGVYHVDCQDVWKKIEAHEKEIQVTDEANDGEEQLTKLAGKNFMPEMKPEKESKSMGSDALLHLIAQAVVQEASGRIKAEVLEEVKDCLPKQESFSVQEARNLLAELLKDTFPTIVHVRKDGELKHEIKNVHASFARLLKHVLVGRHVYLYGPAGTGKSTAAQQVAEHLNRRYGYISLTPQTPESRILGYMTATGGYVRTEFRECYENGGVYCVDEMDNMSQALATTWNGALENGHMPFPDGLVKRHPDFVMVSTGNTSGAGANPMFPERRPFDKAFSDRFVYIHWGYDTKLERAIAKSFYEDCDGYVDWVIQVRKYAEKNYPKLLPSPRVTYRLAMMLAEGDDVETILDEVYWKGDKEAKDKILANCPLP